MYKPLHRGYFTRREMEALGEPVGMPDRGPAYGERNDPGTIAIVGGGLLAAKMNSDAAEGAADSQLAGVREANALQDKWMTQAREDQAPWRESGNWALQQLREQLSRGFSPSNVQGEAGYQFGMDQGMQTLQNQLAARGMRNSGAALKAGTRFAQDYAGTKFNDAFNRNLQALNPFMSMAGFGQVATNATTQAGMNAANQMGNNAMQAGNVNALSGLAQANQWGNALNQGAGWFSDYMKKGSGLSGPSNADLERQYGFGGR